jgi:hypothetical protein
MLGSLHFSDSFETNTKVSWARFEWRGLHRRLRGAAPDNEADSAHGVSMGLRYLPGFTSCAPSKRV